MTRIHAWWHHYTAQKYPIWEAWEFARKKCVSCADWPPAPVDFGS